MNLVAPCNPSNAKLAPKRYVEEGGHMFQPIPPEEPGSLLPVVLCPVYHGSSGLLLQILPGRLAEGREKALHILELLFPEE